MRLGGEGKLGIPGSDKGRTASAQIGYKGFNFGFQVVTNTPSPDFRTAISQKGNWLSRTWGTSGRDPGSYNENSRRITSPFYLGYSHGNFNYRIGLDAPLVHDIIQNGWHSLIGSPWFRTDYDTPTRIYSFFGNTLSFLF